jgi:hypothetical protein
MTNISIDLHDLFDAGDLRRPAEIIKALGITYKRAEGISHTDVMHFYDCENIPETLPPYVSAWERK